MRDLIISESINLNGCKEFNHLRVTNISEFLSEYGNNLDYYASPFKILAELEDKIKFKNNPDEYVLVSYKLDGDIMFKKIDVKEDGNRRVVVYEYDGVIS